MEFKTSESAGCSKIRCIYCILKAKNSKLKAAVAQAMSDYGLDDRGSIPDSSRGFFF
jgi:hypothetical protein